MALTHSHDFQIRYYETDPYNRLTLSNYLRFMQEAAIEASTQAGYGGAQYSKMHRQWLIRETGLEIFRPVGAGDQVQVDTWVADFRRVSSRRLYQFHQPGDHEPIASAYSDWVFIDTDTGEPAAIPAEVIADFFPDGSPSKLHRKANLLPAPPPPAMVFRTSLQVAWRDLDTLMHVNNANYPIFAEGCGYEVMASFGWPMSRLRDEQLSIHIVKARIEYLLPAVLGDSLDIVSWMYIVSETQMGRHFELLRQHDRVLIVRMDLVYEWGNVISGDPIRIPTNFKQDLASNTSVNA